MNKIPYIFYGNAFRHKRNWFPISINLSNIVININWGFGKKCKWIMLSWLKDDYEN